MSSIGLLQFLQMSGPQIPVLADRVVTIDRPGVDGEAFRAEPQKVREIEIQTVEPYTALANANAAADTYQSLQGYLVTVIDDMGRTTPNVMVLLAEVTRPVQTIVNPTTSGINYLVFGRWQLKPTQ